jgi:hypothetical protein
MHRTIRYSLEKFADCYDGDGKKLKAFTIRTTDGEDETYSAKRAEAKGTNLSEELIRFSIVSYENEDGVKEAKQPFESFDKWSTKARNFCVAAWKKLSSPDEKEIEDFFKSASEAE